MQRVRVVESNSEDDNSEQDHVDYVEAMGQINKSEQPMVRVFALGKMYRALKEFVGTDLKQHDIRLLKGVYTAKCWELADNEERDKELAFDFDDIKAKKT